MLRIHDRGIFRAEAEKRGVEKIDVIEYRGGFDVGGIAQIVRVNSRRE